MRSMLGRASTKRVVGGNRKRPPGLPTTFPIVVDREDLAWAAGFYDGEGCTLTVDPERLYPWIGVTQGGSLDGPPEVLVRFKRAVGGIGHIDGPEVFEAHPDWMPRWRYRVAG